VVEQVVVVEAVMQLPGRASRGAHVRAASIAVEASRLPREHVALRRMLSLRNLLSEAGPAFAGRSRSGSTSTG